jgi:hypothetical protein
MYAFEMLVRGLHDFRGAKLGQKKLGQTSRFGNLILAYRKYPKWF